MDDCFLTVILMLIAGALLTVTTGLWAMSELEQLGPSVGGAIVFKPDRAATQQWSVKAAIADRRHVGLPNGATDGLCVLSPGVMALHGGSLIIEARRLSTPPAYRVHWAGGHTSAGVGDCGTQADLVLERNELMRLANVAGGVSNGLGLIRP
jgi:hypothetical protein